MQYACQDFLAFIPLPGMLLTTGILFEQRIRRITVDLLYIGFTFQTKNKLQECNTFTLCGFTRESVY